MERFEARDGVGIAYRQWNAGASAIPVVLHHGFVADGALNWEGPGVVKALVETGRWVVTLDATAPRTSRTTPRSTARPSWPAT